MELAPFRQKAFYNVDDRISGLLLVDKETCDRVFVSDWSGRLQILKFEKKAGPDPKVLRTYKKEDSSVAILSIDMNRSTNETHSDQVLIGGSDGSLDCYHLEPQKCINIGRDNEERRISKVVSVQGSSIVFSFSWDRVMQIWDLREKWMVFYQKFKENFITAEYLHPYIVLIFGDNSIAFIHVERYTHGHPIGSRPTGHSELIKSIALKNSLKEIAFGDIKGTVEVFERCSEDLNFGNYTSRGSTLLDHYKSTFAAKAHSLPYKTDKSLSRVHFPSNALGFRPQTTRLFSGGGDSYISMVDYEEDDNNNKTNLYTWKGTTKQCLQNPITHLKFNKEGTSLLVAETQETYHNIFDEDFSYKPNSTIRMLQLADSD